MAKFNIDKYSMGEKWKRLPITVLFEIFEYLSYRDRLSCRKVCRYWYWTSVHPALWKVIQVNLFRDLGDPLTINLLKSYRKHITTLHLKWCSTYIPRRWFRNVVSTISSNTCLILMAVRDFRIRLKEFRLTNLKYSPKFNKVAFYASLFLEDQYRLRVISLYNAKLSEKNVTRILCGLKNSKDYVREINLLGSIHPPELVPSSRKFCRVFLQFTKLEVLKVDYASISDRVLRSFTVYKNKLNLLEIHFTKTGKKLTHKISTETWKQLIRNCNDLHVSLHIFNVPHHDDIAHIFNDAMPLTSFTLNCGLTWDRRRCRNYKATLSLLMDKYAHCLTQMTLKLFYNCEILDLLIYDLISTCVHLQYFEFDGLLHSEAMLERIRDYFYYENKQNFEYFQILPKTSVTCYRKSFM